MKANLICTAILVVSGWPFQLVEGALPENLAEALEHRIHTELEKALEELITEKRSCEELWLTWPLNEPEKTIADVEEDVENLIQEKSVAAFPASLEEKYQEEALVKFTLFKVGEPIRIKLKNGDELGGYLREIKRNKVLVDNRTIHLAEIDNEEMAHFDEAVRQVKVREYVRKKMVELKEARFEYEEKIKDQISRQLYLDAGYSLVMGNWISKKRFVKEHMGRAREKLIVKLTPLLRSKVYFENGYVQFEDEWITQEEAKQRRQKAEEERLKLEALEVEEQDQATAEEEGDLDDEGSLWE